MKYIPNTFFIRAIRWTFFSACLAVLASVPFARPALAAAHTNNDKVFIASEDILSEKDMGVKRGGTVTTTTVTSNQTMNSTSTGNEMVVWGSLTNGQISVGDNFGGSGFGSYVMNTGNNSVINSGVSLSVLMMQ
jgi:hypothetical protein